MSGTTIADIQLTDTCVCVRVAMK